MLDRRDEPASSLPATNAKRLRKGAKRRLVRRSLGEGGCGERRRDKLTRRANHFGFSEVLSSPGIKNISLSPSGKSKLYPSPSRPTQRGVGHRHERWGGLQWTRTRL